MSGRLIATVLGAIGTLLWAAETTLITYTIRVPPLQTVALAFVFASMLSPLVWWFVKADPFEAFRQPVRVWLFTVGSLAGYHACIYYATQKAPPAAAALLQGTTPLMIVVGSALLPGERLRWWHVVGASMGLCGVLLLIDNGGKSAPSDSNATFYLCLIGLAAGLWGLYSVVSRSLPDLPTSALGVFYAAAGLTLGLLHLVLEDWVQPTRSEWAALAGLGIVPMGLAIYLWDYGIKRGDIQALGSFSYVEPFIGAVLVAIFTHGVLGWSLIWSGALVVSGAILGSASLWRSRPSKPLKNAAFDAVSRRPPEKWSSIKVARGPLEGRGMPEAGDRYVMGAVDRSRGGGRKPQEIVAKLREVEVLVSQGQRLAEAIRSINVTPFTYYRWRKEFGGLKADHVKRLKELEEENQWLRMAVSDLINEKLISRETAPACCRSDMG